MAVRPILLWPDARLSQVCAPLEHVDDGARRLVADMIETMYDAKGRGLAAPQIGVLQRVFVMDCAPKDAPAAPQVFCNPEIIYQRVPRRVPVDPGYGPADCATCRNPASVVR